MRSRRCATSSAATMSLLEGIRQADLILRKRLDGYQFKKAMTKSLSMMHWRGTAR